MLPVATIVRETYTHVVRHIGSFAVVVGGATAVVALAYLLLPFFVMFAAHQVPASALAVRALTLFSVTLLPIVMAAGWIFAAVRWHRFILIEEPATAPIRSLWHPARTYFLRILAIYVPVGVVSLYAAQVLMVVRSPYALLALSFVAAMVLGRVAIAFPAAAVGDRRVGFLAAIRLTRGNTTRLLLVWLAAVLPLEVLRYLTVHLAVWVPSAWFHQAVQLAFTSASILMAVTAVSLCYRHFAQAEVKTAVQ